MKIWPSFASEHSSALVLIGRFKTVELAERAHGLIEKLSELASTEQAKVAGQGRYASAVLEFVKNADLFSIGPDDVDAFNMDFQTKLDGSTLTIETDEFDVIGQIKIMIEMKAKIEIYSAHDYPDDPSPSTDVASITQDATTR